MDVFSKGWFDSEKIDCSDGSWRIPRRGRHWLRRLDSDETAGRRQERRQEAHPLEEFATAMDPQEEPIASSGRLLVLCARHVVFFWEVQVLCGL